MQTAQNKCVRFCLNFGNRAHIRIKELQIINWLPTQRRFEQGVCVGIFNFFENTDPLYIEMYHPVKQSHHTVDHSKNLVCSARQQIVV